ncbi:MAG: hypothetical protein LUG99_04620, partial [Lachnospiraceae bacterium]|nr:hypothetical protein [Lachnospiraceae bacterium]
MGKRRRTNKNNLQEEKEINQEITHQEIIEEAETESIDTDSEKESFELMENKGTGRPDKRLFLFAALAVIWLIVVYSFAGQIFNDEPENTGADQYQASEEPTEESETDFVSETVLVTGTGDSEDEDASLTGIDTAAAGDGEIAETQTGADSINESNSDTDDEGETENWQATIFGTSEATILSSIKISGLTDAQKEKSGFRESDFLKVLSSFLADNDLDEVTEVIFENEILCSSEDAIAFCASLDNYENQLTV